jgi:hypothetical protein
VPSLSYLPPLVTALTLAACSSSFREVDAGAPDGNPGDSAVDDAALDTGADTGWTLVYEDPKAEVGESLNAIWVADQDSVFSVGDNGQAVWLENGKWIELNKTKGLDLYGVWGRSDKDVYAVGRYELDQLAAIQHYDGDRWYAEGPLPKGWAPLSAVWGTPTGTKRYFTSLDGTIYAHTTSKGYQVVVQTGGCPSVGDPAPVIWAIDGSSFDNALAVADDGLSAHRDESGWVRLCHPDTKVRFRSVFSVPGTKNFYMGANYLGLWRFTGRGDPVLKIHEDRGTPGADNRHLWSIWGTSEARILAVGDGGTLLYFDGSGSGPTQLPSPTKAALFGVSGFDEKHVYICGEGNRIWRGELPSK